MKLSSPQQHLWRAGGFSLIELVISVVIIAVLFVLSMNSIKSMRETSQQTICATNMRTLHRALMQYTQEHGGFLPPAYDYGSPVATRVWITKLVDYDIKYYSRNSPFKSDTYCPSTSDKKTGIYYRDAVDWRLDYSVNENVATATITNNHLSAILFTKVLFFDGKGSTAGGATDIPANDASFLRRHKNRFNAIFIDGHIELLESTSDMAGRWKR